MNNKLPSLKECFEEDNTPLIYQEMTKRSSTNTVKVQLVALEKDKSKHSIGSFYKHVSRTISKFTL